jgi:hypothetical protein
MQHPSNAIWPKADCRLDKDVVTIASARYPPKAVIWGADVLKINNLAVIIVLANQLSSSQLLILMPPQPSASFASPRTRAMTAATFPPVCHMLQNAVLKFKQDASA